MRLTHRRALILCVLLVAGIGTIVLHRYLSFEYVYLFKDIGDDTLNAFLPKLVHVADYLRAEGIPKWSFNRGMGQNIFPGDVNVPFRLILYLLGADRIPYGIAYVELLKLIAAASLFHLYVRAMGFGPFACLVGGLLYAFSGYMIVGSGWYSHSTSVVYAALLLLAFERLFRADSWALFPVATFLIAGPRLYFFALFLLPYATVRFIEERGFDPKRYAVLLLKTAGYGALGVALGAPMFISSVHNVLASPRVGGTVSYAETLSSTPMFALADRSQLVTAILRLFSNDLLGTGSDFKGWNNYLEAPAFYSGLITLLLVAQLAAVVRRKHAVLYGLALALWLPLVAFPYFRYAAYLFSGNYYKHFVSVFVPVTLLCAGLKALNAIEQGAKPNRTILCVSLLVLLGALYYPYFPWIVYAVDRSIRLAVTLFLLAYAVLLFLLGRVGRRRLIVYAVLCVLCVEVAYLSWFAPNRREMVSSAELHRRAGYNDYTRDAIHHVRSLDDGFYRVEKDYDSSPAVQRSFNDGMIQGYYGTQSYSSFNQGAYIEFLQGMGIAGLDDEAGTRWARGLADRPLLQTLASVKYNLSKKRHPRARSLGYRFLGRFGNVTLFENPEALPLGFTYDRAVSRSRFDGLERRQKDLALLQAGVFEEEDRGLFADFASRGAPRLERHSREELASHLRDRRAESLELIRHGQNEIVGSITMTSPKILFFSIPYDPSWSATVDGSPEELRRVNLGFMGLLLVEGTHSVELRFRPPHYVASLAVATGSLIFYLLMLGRTLAARRSKRSFLRQGVPGEPS